MRVVLLTDVPGTGKKDDVVEVKDGYGRNFLLPKGLAEMATANAEKIVAQRKERAAQRESAARRQQEALADQLRGHTVVIKAHAGEAGRLFGAVTNADIARALAEQGYVVDRHKISMDPVKHLGTTSASVHLYAGVEVPIMIQVIADSGK